MNWGTKLFLIMLSFILFIVAMVIYMFSVHSKDALIDDDYYEKGINYNQEYDAKANLIKDDAAPLITINEKQIIIQLKDSATYELKLMRPSKAKDDIKDSGVTISDHHLILINTTGMHKGFWFLELSWTSQNKKYLFKRDIIL